MSDERRALRELARLYGVQESFTDVFGKRVPAGVDSTIAVLRAMGAPLSSLADADDALRLRRDELARRPLEPVIVAWGGRLSHVDVHVPVSDPGGRHASRSPPKGRSPIAGKPGSFRWEDRRRPVPPRRGWRSGGGSRGEGTTCGSTSPPARSEPSCSRRRGSARSPTGGSGVCSRRCTPSAPRTTGGWGASPSSGPSEAGSRVSAAPWRRRFPCSRSSSTSRWSSRVRTRRRAASSGTRPTSTSPACPVSTDARRRARRWTTPRSASSSPGSGRTSSPIIRPSRPRSGGSSTPSRSRSSGAPSRPPWRVRRRPEGRGLRAVPRGGGAARRVVGGLATGGA